MSLSDYQALLQRLVRDDSDAVTAEDRDRALDAARLRYSADMPRSLVEDVTWPATDYFGPLPLGWVEGAWLQEAESPPEAMPPAFIDVGLYVGPDGSRLAIPYTLAAGSVVRVRYGAPHLLCDLPEPQDTIPAVHREAVAGYAAHLLLRQLATLYSGERETSIAADGSNTDSRARNYAARAKEYRTMYYGGIGKPDPVGAGVAGGAGSAGGGMPAASAVAAWPGRRRFGLIPRGCL